MAGEPRPNYIGLPDLEPGRCGWSLDLSSPRCEAPAEWHIWGASPFGSATTATCGVHFSAGRASLLELYGSHPFGDGCRFEETIWLDDHCVEAPAVPSSKEPTE